MPAVMPDQPRKNYVTVKVGGQDIQVDSQTGEIQPLTPQEAEKLAAGLKPMLNKSSDGLVTVQHPDGSMSMDLQGHFQNVAVARVNKDGTVSQSCVDNPRAAGAFSESIRNKLKTHPIALSPLEIRIIISNEPAAR